MIEGWEVSEQQAHVWRLEKARPGAAYRVSACVALDGNLDAGGLRQALRRVVERHEILRTTLRCVPGLDLPLQTVDDAVPQGDLPEVDLRHLPAAERGRRLRERWQAVERRTAGDVGAAGLRVELVRTRETESFLLLALPATCGDDETLEIVLREVATLYGGDRLDADSVQYADFAGWQSDLLATAEAQASLEHWRGQLVDGFDRWDLGPAGAGSSVPTISSEGRVEPARIAVRVPSRVVAGLTRGEGEHDLEDLVLGSWWWFLGRLSGGAPRVLGVRYDGRGAPETAAAVGPFARYLPLRLDSSSEGSFTSCVGRVVEAKRAGRRWQDAFSWSRMMGEGVAEPSLPVLFDWYEEPPEEIAGGVRWRLVERRSVVDAFVLRLTAERRGDALRLELHYAPGTVPDHHWGRLLERYLCLLSGLAENPGGGLEAGPAWGSAARHEVLVENNATARVLPEETLPVLLARRVRETPDAIAVAAGGVAVTFAELSRRAGRLARALGRHRVGAESVVAVLSRRTPNAVAAFLGVLEAGAAYLPLDPGQPADRLELLLADSNARLVVAEGRFATSVPACDLPILALEPTLRGPDPGLRGQPGAAAPCGPISTDALAYVLYTSGSSGRPKGVMVPHRALVNYLLWAVEQYRLRSGRGALLHSPLGFDLTVTSLFGPLLAGRPVRVVPEDEPEALAALLAAGSGPALLKLTPSHLTALASLLPEAPLPAGPEVLVVGGEALHRQHLEAWNARSSATRVFNEYGPTETVVGCAVHELPPGGPVPAQVPIGRPIANTRLYVCDAHLLPVPGGIPGELHVAGLGVTRGYHRRPAATAAAFLPDPFAGEPGRRLYKTGDRVVLTATDGFVFLGRLDDQLKLRGFRIEPGEVEAALLVHPEVAEAAVVGDPGGALLAYLVAVPEASLDVAELRGRLERRLPPYMVPSAFAVLRELPRTPNGKVDRRALARTTPEPAAAAAAPRTPTEGVILDLWNEVLAVPVADIHRRLFDLGGQSLTVLQLLARVRDVFEVDVEAIDFFAEPTVAGLARLVDAALRGSGETAVMPPLEPMSRDRPLPLSFGQERLWVIDRLEPEASAAYNIALAVGLEGRLDRRALGAAVRDVVDRHESLRTRFRLAAGGPEQVVDPVGEARLSWIDLRSLPASLRGRAIGGMEPVLARRGFDLARGPLLRVALVLVGDERHDLLLNLHHIVADGWSLGVLLRDLGALYAARSEGRPAELPALAIQYADYAAWQRRWLDDAGLETDLAYWRECLRGVPAVLHLPTDRPRPSVRTSWGSRRPVHIPARLADALAAHARKRDGVTLSMILLAGFHALLRRLSGQSDLAVGVPVAGRDAVAVEPLIGFFVNTLVLRADLTADPSFEALAEQTRHALVQAFSHRHVPFERVVDEVLAERDPALPPLVQAVFVLQNVPWEEWRPEGLRWHPRPLATETAKFDLTLSLTEVEDGLRGTVEYDRALFDATTLDRWIGSFERLLEGAVERPKTPVSMLPLLARCERQQLLEWAAAADPVQTGHVPVYRRFEDVAAALPCATAVVCGDRQLSYAELERVTRKLAGALVARGLEAGQKVAVCLEPSLDLVVALVGVLRAGGAYVPLDPFYPSERVAWVLDELLRGEPNCLVVTREELEERHDLARRAGAGRLVLLPLFDQGCEELPRDDAPPDTLAYVIYTSGTTGRPRGVGITHRNMARLFTAARRQVELGPGTTWTLFHSYAFDVSVWEMWGALTSGGRLVVVPRDTRRSPPEHFTLLARERVTVLNQTPSAFRILVEHAVAKEDPAALALRQVIFAGEALDAAGLREWLRWFSGGGPEFINMYGITETTVHVTLRKLTAGEIARTDRPPIGRALPDLALHVLDDGLDRVPMGVAGEIFVGGPGLARGYLGHPDRTALSFVPDPFAAVPGHRLYRSGDRARHRADGDLEFLGRTDHQLKVRGFRIEPGEIEAVLRQHPAVTEAVVTGVPGPAGLRLVAHVSHRTGHAPTPAELLGMLKERLPEHMVPAAFGILESLPSSPSGKVDRAALPPLDDAAFVRSTHRVAPRTPHERLLVELWCRVLGVDSIGIHDNFFDLGGDSIQVIRFVAAAHEHGLQLTPKQVFRHQTVAELVDVAAATSDRGVAPDDEPAGGPIPLTPIQSWFFAQDLPERHHWNQSVVLNVPPDLDFPALAGSLDLVIARHDALRLRFEEAEDGWTQRAEEPGGRGGEAHLAVVDLGRLAEDRRRPAVTAAVGAAQRSLDLGRGPLVRAVWLPLGTGEAGRLLLTVHHLGIDIVSWGILLDELQAAFRALSRGEPPALLPPSSSFGAWAKRLAPYAGTAPVRAQASYWLDPAWGEVAPLPIDGDRSANLRGTEVAVEAALDAEVTRELRDRATELYRARLEEVVLAGLVQAISAWTGSPYVAVELEGHGREEILDNLDVSRSVGWFTSLYPVLLSVEPGIGPGEALAAVKEQVRRVPGKGLGYGLLRWLAGDADLARRLAANHRAEVTFNFLGRIETLLTGESSFSMAPEPVGRRQSPRGPRSHLLDVVGHLAGDRLVVYCTYSNAVHRREVVERLTSGIVSSLEALAAHCRGMDSAALTPSDFPRASLSQDQLDALLDRLEEVEGP